MKTPIKTLLYAALCAAAAKGTAITFTESQLGSGMLDGAAFNNQVVTITLTGDTSTLSNPSPGLFQIFGTATVNAGLVTDTFTGSTDAFVNVSVAGITDGVFDILDTGNAAFATYPLTTSIGPLSGSPAGNPAHIFSTVGGSFSLTSSNNPRIPSTFTATVGTPEPGTMALSAAGIGLVLIRSRRLAQHHLHRLSKFVTL